MSAGRTEEDAMLLLEGFYDLSGGKPNEPVPVGGSESTEAEAAAPRVGIDPESPNCEVAVRYLLDQGYVKSAGEDAATYTLTVPGIDQVKSRRGE